MVKKLTYTLLLALIALPTLAADINSEGETKGLRWSYIRGLEYRLKAGFTIGGTSPIPLPEEIRKINSYNPTMQVAVEANMVKWFDKKGLLLGIRLENKGMKTDARVKNYGMEIIDDGVKVKGNWTGDVKTNVQLTYLTIPVLAVFKLTPRWEVQAGGFVSYMTKGEFSGSVYNGYLREGDPTGEKMTFEGDSYATYNFDNELRHFQCGAEVGAQWQAYRHLYIYGDLTWGVIPVFKSSFKTITFNMFPIYANFGFAYKF